MNYPKRPKNGAPRFKTINESLSWWMTSQRELLGISQAYAAKRIGLARATYSIYERGQRTPTLRDFVKICKHLYIPTQAVIDDAEWEL